MGSTSYIIPLRSESDEGYEPEPPPPLPPMIFRNKVAPTLPTTVQAEPMQLIQSRSPLFRAKSKEYDRNLSQTEMTTAINTSDISCSNEMLIQNESSAAKIKRSIFSNKSNSAGASSAARSSKSYRSSSAKSSKKS